MRKGVLDVQLETGFLRWGLGFRFCVTRGTLDQRGRTRIHEDRRREHAHPRWNRHVHQPHNSSGEPWQRRFRRPSPAVNTFGMVKDSGEIYVQNSGWTVDRFLARDGGTIFSSWFTSTGVPQRRYLASSAGTLEFSDRGISGVLKPNVFLPTEPASSYTFLGTNPVFNDNGDSVAFVAYSSPDTTSTIAPSGAFTPRPVRANSARSPTITRSSPAASGGSRSQTLTRWRSTVPTSSSSAAPQTQRRVCSPRPKACSWR